MTKIKALFLETHYADLNGKVNRSGVDFARIVNPGNYLQHHPDFEVEIRKNPTEGYPEKTWEDVAKNWDLLFSSYIDTPVGYVLMAMACKKFNKPFVTDIDDNIWEVPKDSPVYKVFYPGSQTLHAVSCALEDTPYVTTTNQFLKYRLVKYCNKRHEDVKVLPNYIDLSLYDYRKLYPKQTGTINIHYYGTGTHYGDVMMPEFRLAMTRILKEYPQVNFVTTGLWLIQLKTMWKKQYRTILGKKDFDLWIDLWAQIMGDADIVVAPLLVTDFNRSKSNIKFLEFSAAKKPGVFQRIRQYEEMVGTEQGKRGFLAGTQEEWYVALKTLIENEQLRQSIGEAAYAYVKANHTIQAHVEDYANYFKMVLSDHHQTHHLRDSGFILPDTLKISTAL